MKTLYLDIFSGISGDMFIGAMLDLGVDFHQLDHALEKLGLHEYHLHAARKLKSNIEGVKFDVHLAHEHHHHAEDHQAHDHGHSHSDEAHHEHHHHEHGHSHAHEHTHTHEHHEHGRNFAEIKELIRQSKLSDWVKERSVSIFQRVANAEGKIHGKPPSDVHFHEVGAIDSIVDIVGACIALEMLGKPRVIAAPVIEGTGWINCAHGRFPIPTAATLEILGARGIALTQCEEPHELVTPTGAALLAEFAESFGPMKNLVAEKIGYGLGTRDNHTRPNVLRAVLGKTPTATSLHDWETDSIAVVETNIDDSSAEVLGHFITQAMNAGALDVFHTPIQMKKNRPGVLLTVLCNPEGIDQMAELILRETSAFGVRHHLTERRKLQRRFTEVGTPYGPVKMKLGSLDGRIIQAAPEFDSCKALAEASGTPLKEVYQAALISAREIKS